MSKKDKLEDNFWKLPKNKRKQLLKKLKWLKLKRK